MKVNSKCFSLHNLNKERVIGQRLIDIVFMHNGDYEQLDLMFEDGTMIEIVPTENSEVEIQTD